MDILLPTRDSLLAERFAHTHTHTHVGKDIAQAGASQDGPDLDFFLASTIEVRLVSLTLGSSLLWSDLQLNVGFTQQSAGNPSQA